MTDDEQCPRCGLPPTAHPSTCPDTLPRDPRDPRAQQHSRWCPCQRCAANTPAEHRTTTQRANEKQAKTEEKA